MLRVGIMLDSYVSSSWVAKIVADMKGSDFASLELVVLNTPAVQEVPGFKKRIRNYWKLALYHRFEQWDYARNKLPHDAKAVVDLKAALEQVPSIQVEPLRKGFTDRFSEPDLEAIRGYHLDVLFRFGFRIVRGGILGVARYGVWSFHHGDNRQYRGGPPLFWEIYEDNPISGTVLQILTDSLDGGHVIYRSHSSTDRTSLYRSRNPIYWKTASFALRRLRDLNEYGMEYLKALPTYTETEPYTRGIYRTPDAGQMAVFAWRLAVRSLRARLDSKLHGDCRQWFIAVRRRGEEGFDSGSRYTTVMPPGDRFYADPFLIQRGERTYLFFEDLRFAEGRARISCCELGLDGVPGKPFEVLQRPYHLSYPFIFEQDGETYMIPETKQNRTVELYRATDFPSKWELEAVLLEDIYAVDATVHEQDCRWWMFVGTSNGLHSNSEELSLFYANDLRGPWITHPANPVVSDVRCARPAGALFRDRERLIRPSQDCGERYGCALVFSEILKLSETEYEEKPVGRLGPEWMAGNLGTHTYSRTEDFEAIDGNRAAKGH